MSLLASVSVLMTRLRQHGVEGALVGGLAVSVRCDPRFTLDADVAVAASNDDEAEALVRFLVHSGYVLTATAEQQATGRLAMVRLEDGAGVSLDVLFASSGVERDVVAACEHLEVVPGLVLPVARVGHLIAMKLLSVAEGRETDAADLRQLAAIADEEEWDRARRAVTAITDLGFDRGRDLGAALTSLRAST